MTYALVVVGGGNMGAALVGGLLDSGVVTADRMAIAEASPERRAVLGERFGGVAVVGEVPPCDAAVLSVKPPDAAAVAAAAARAGARRVLSVAAGVTTATLAAAVAPHARAGVAVVRAMPNTPALVRQGVSALAAGPGAAAADVDWAESVLAGVGIVVRVDEPQLDAVTGLTGSGPAYVFLVAEALTEAGVAAGLPRATVEPMVTQLLVGSSALLAAEGDPTALREMVTSPGGTTAAGVRVLDDRAVRAAFIEAVQAATGRSRELGAG